MTQVVLAVAPTEKGRIRSGENLGIRYIYAFLKSRGISTELFDAQADNLSVGQLIDAIRLRHPMLVGLSVPSQSLLESTIEVATGIKATVKCHVTLGGHFPTFAADELLARYDVLDSIVRGEGELTCRALVQAIASNGSLKQVRSLVFRENGSSLPTQQVDASESLDSLPFPVRSRRDPAVYNMAASRGCYGSCTFCSIPGFYREVGIRSWRGRSADNVVNEMLQLQQMGAVGISFVDDTFVLPGTFGKERIRAFVDAIHHSNVRIPWAIGCRADVVEESLFREMKNVGLRNVGLGIESGSQSMLDRFSKGTSVEDNAKAIQVLGDIEISVLPYFIMFDAFVEPTELKDSLRFLTHHEVLWPSLLGTRLEVYLGTESHRRYQQLGIIEMNNFTYKYQIQNSTSRGVFGHFRGISRVGENVEQRMRKLEFVFDTRETGDNTVRPEYHVLKKAFMQETFSAANDALSLAISGQDELAPKKVESYNEALQGLDAHLASLEIRVG